MTTIVTPQSLSTITLSVWDTRDYYPLGGVAAFTEFADTYSVHGPLTCPKTYSFTMTTNTLQNFALDTTLKQFDIYSGSYNQIGDYIVTFRAEVTAYPSQFTTTTFSVIIKDPCLKTTLTPPPVPFDMTTSVMV